MGNQIQPYKNFSLEAFTDCMKIFTTNRQYSQKQLEESVLPDLNMQIILL